jgi:hypothetical protein
VFGPAAPLRESALLVLVFAKVASGTGAMHAT